VPGAKHAADAKVVRAIVPCATESGRYELTGRLVNVGGNRYTGWVQQGNQSGRASLVQHGNRLSITVTSRQGLAQLTLARLG
jgi:hypothetical protein